MAYVTSNRDRRQATDCMALGSTKGTANRYPLLRYTFEDSSFRQDCRLGAAHIIGAKVAFPIESFRLEAWFPMHRVRIAAMDCHRAWRACVPFRIPTSRLAVPSNRAQLATSQFRVWSGSWPHHLSYTVQNQKGAAGGKCQRQEHNPKVDRLDLDIAPEVFRILHFGHSTVRPSLTALSTISPMYLCSTTIESPNVMASAGKCSATHSSPAGVSARSRKMVP